LAASFLSRELCARCRWLLLVLLDVLVAPSAAAEGAVWEWLAAATPAGKSASCVPLLVFTLAEFSCLVSLLLQLLVHNALCLCKPAPFAFNTALLMPLLLLLWLLLLLPMLLLLLLLLMMLF
jgi:hypothetical protein